MGESKRRKRLDPSYGKTIPKHWIETGKRLFPDQFLNDYYSFWLSVRNPGFAVDANHVESLLSKKWNTDAISNYMNKLDNIAMQEFGIFLLYICSTNMGSIFIKGVEVAMKRKAVEEDLFTLWKPFIMASLDGKKDLSA